MGSHYRKPDNTPAWAQEVALGKTIPGENYWDTDTKSALMKARGYRLVDGVWVP